MLTRFCCFFASGCLFFFLFQAKTTKKIVLKLQCQSCKHYSQRAIKVPASLLSALPFPCYILLCVCI
uniref:Uncharacterized protein n=1 Tax=Aegilops tauschii subsp. strangulata TaxID=200361 RepID=A0A453SVQ4_AEGTS